MRSHVSPSLTRSAVGDRLVCLLAAWWARLVSGCCVPYVTRSSCSRVTPALLRSAKKGGLGGMFGMLKGLVGSKSLTREDMDPVLEKMKDHLIGMSGSAGGGSPRSVGWQRPRFGPFLPTGTTTGSCLVSGESSTAHQKRGQRSSPVGIPHMDSILPSPPTSGICDLLSSANSPLSLSLSLLKQKT